MIKQNGNVNPNETVNGTVEATNPKGIKVAGRWLNYSQYDDVTRPERGQVVQVQAKGNFIKALAVLDDGTTARQGHAGAREMLIVRQTCIKAAAEFCASRPELKSADLFALAERMERWCHRANPVGDGATPSA